MLSYIGIVLIIVGWLFQLFSKGKNISVKFVLTYVLGVAFLTANILMEEITVFGILELVSFLSALAVLIKIRK